MRRWELFRFAGGVDGHYVQPVGSRVVRMWLMSSATLPKRENAVALVSHSRINNAIIVNHRAAILNSSTVLGLLLLAACLPLCWVLRPTRRPAPWSS